MPISPTTWMTTARGRLAGWPHTVLWLVTGAGAALPAVLGLPAQVAQAAIADKATDDFNLGVGLYRSSRWELAAETFAQFLQEFPEHPRHNVARLYYGLSLSSLERYAEARPQFAAYIKAEPDSAQAADARYRLGECSYYLKDYPNAATQLQDFLQRHAQHSLADWATLFLGDTYLGQNQPDKAAAVLRPLVSKPPAGQLLADAQFALARAVESAAAPDEALQLYRAVAADQKSPLAPRALARIGTLHFNRQQFAEAAKAYDEVVERYPGTPLAASARLNSGLALFRAGTFDTAIERFRGVEQSTPHYAQAVFMTALSLKELGRLAEARQSFADALTSAGNTALAADIVFQRAQLERADGQPLLAAQMFEDLVDRWPTDKRAADCLFNAADLRLEVADPDSTARLWKRLASDFPAVAAEPRAQVLLGRLQLQQKQTEQAVRTLQQVVDKPAAGTSGRVLAVGRYYLIRALFDAGQHAAVLQQTQPLQQLLQTPEMQDLRSALALAAISGLQVPDYQATRQFADQFLEIAKDEKQRADVLAARVVALAHLQQFMPAIADARTLVELLADRPQSWSAILQAADAATQTQAFADAAALFALAAQHPSAADIQEAGFTGVAWSRFRAQDHAAAETAFAEVVRRFPKSPDAAQAIYMEARCIEEQGDSARAAARYQQVLQQLTADVAAIPEEAETRPPLQYAYDAGRQAARMLGRLQQTDAADQQWELLVKTFPAARDLDRVLDEWAFLNLNAERFEKSDQIYRKLLQQFPESPFAGQARLSLAESDMQAGRMDVALREFEAIIGEPRYGAAEQERALFHVIDILTAQRNWTRVRSEADKFLQQYVGSQLSPQVRLLSAEARLNTARDGADVTAALDELQKLRSEVLAQTEPAEEWTERIWVVLAEAALLAKNYAQIDEVAEELTSRNAKSRFQFQMHDVQGRRWKTQSPPDFARSREYFRRVTDDETGRGTETAARCQFLIAETYVLEKNFEDARREYLRTYVTYPWETWQVQALYQAAGCEEQLALKDAAIRSYQELISKFPASEFAAKAREHLSELAGAAP